MPRFINPVPQYKPNSKLFFFESGTNTQLATYKDQTELIPNTHPVLTDSAGFVPNIFFSVIAKLVVLDENDVQYIERDPVESSASSGGSLLWEESQNYSQNDLVQGSDSKYYVSLINDNVSNDPTVSLVQWSEVRFIGVWNTNETYSIGDVVQTVNGDLWKAITATAGNDPAIDDGTNWLIAIDTTSIETNATNISENTDDIDALEDLLVWKNKSAAFTAVVNESYQIDGSTITVDASLPATLTIGDQFIIHNESISTNEVRVLNPIFTIKGAGATLSPGDNLILEPGDTAHIVARSTTILEVV